MFTFNWLSIWWINISIYSPQKIDATLHSHEIIIKGFFEIYAYFRMHFEIWQVNQLYLSQNSLVPMDIKISDGVIIFACLHIFTLQYILLQICKFSFYIRFELIRFKIWLIFYLFSCKSVLAFYYLVYSSFIEGKFVVTNLQPSNFTEWNLSSGCPRVICRMDRSLL